MHREVSASFLCRGLLCTWVFMILEVSRFPGVAVVWPWRSGAVHDSSGIGRGADRQPRIGHQIISWAMILAASLVSRVAAWLEHLDLL